MKFFCRMGSYDDGKQPDKDEIDENVMCALCRGRGGTEHCRYSRWDGRTDKQKKKFMKELITELSKPTNIKQIQKERAESKGVCAK